MAAPTAGAMAITRERSRQVDFEGWTPEHDLHHDAGELLAAASAYLRAVELRRVGWPNGPVQKAVALQWPWDPSTFKPSDDAHDLARAGALLAAELDRLAALGARLP